MDDFVSLVERSLSAIGDLRTDQFLERWPPRPWLWRQAAPRRLPVLQWLDAAVTNSAPEFCAIAKDLGSLAGSLAWAQTYSSVEVGDAFLDRYGWTELVGLRGLIQSETLAVGFLLLGPQAEYPTHRHMAEELYVPISGKAQWRRGDALWREQPPGAPIYHASNESHAMRTSDEPLLALYLWRRGDLAQKSELTESE